MRPIQPRFGKDFDIFLYARENNIDIPLGELIDLSERQPDNWKEILNARKGTVPERSGTTTDGFHTGTHQ